MVRVLFIVFTCLLYASCQSFSITQQSEKEHLGKLMFFDNSLSEPSGQSCATCHTPSVGFADSLSRPISEGITPGLFTNRNSMSISYAIFVPPLSYDPHEEHYFGGLFWDGRADDATEQAAEPFLDPLEMGNSSKDMVVAKIKRASYYGKFTKVYGNIDNVDDLYYAVCDAIACYEASSEVNPFTSKFDAEAQGLYTMTPSEARGLELFKEKGKCAECHILENDPIAFRPLFTDHTYDNLGIPKNPDNQFYFMAPQHNPDSTAWIDLGLGVTVGDEAHNGKFRVPTLRNIALTAPYGHNGYFKTLDDIVHFYNVRDVSDEYGEAEYSATINKDELGDLGLTAQEESDIITFMQTLTDGYITK